MKTLFNVLIFLILIKLNPVISKPLGVPTDYSPQNHSSHDLDMRRSINVFNGLQEDKDRRIIYFNKILDTLRMLMYNTSSTLESCNNISLASQSNDIQCKEYSPKIFNNGSTGFSLTNKESEPIKNNITAGSDQPKLDYERESITISKTNVRHFNATNIMSSHSNYTNKLTVTLTNNTVSNIISSEMSHSKTSQNISSDSKTASGEIHKTSPTTLINSLNISGYHVKGITNLSSSNISDSRVIPDMPLKEISANNTPGTSTASTINVAFPSKSIHVDNVTKAKIINASSLSKSDSIQVPPHEFYLNTSVSDNSNEVTTEPFNIYELLPAILTFPDDAPESPTYDVTTSSHDDSEEISSSRPSTKSNAWSEAFPDYERFPTVTKNIENESEESEESDEYSNLYESSEESAEKSIQFKISSDVLKRYQISAVHSNFSVNKSDTSHNEIFPDNGSTYSTNGPYIELTEDTYTSKIQSPATLSSKTATVTQMTTVTPSPQLGSGGIKNMSQISHGTDSSHHEVSQTGSSSPLTTLLLSKLTASPEKNYDNQKSTATPDTPISVATTLKPSGISTDVPRVSGCNCYNNRVSIKCSNFTTPPVLPNSEAKLTSTVGTTSVSSKSTNNLDTSHTTKTNDTVSLNYNDTAKTSEISLKSTDIYFENSTQPYIQSSESTDDFVDFLEFLYNNVTSSNELGTTEVSTQLLVNETMNEFDNIFEFLYSNETNDFDIPELFEEVPNIKIIPLDNDKTISEASNLQPSTHTETALESPYSINTYLSELGITESLLETLYSQTSLNTNSDLESSSEESDGHSTVTSNDSSEELGSSYSSPSTLTESSDGDLLSDMTYSETPTRGTNKPLAVIALPSKAAITKKTKSKLVTSRKTTATKLLKVIPLRRTNTTKGHKLISSRRKTTPLKLKVLNDTKKILDKQRTRTVSSPDVYSESNTLTEVPETDEIVAETFVDSVNLFQTTDNIVNSLNANTVEEIVEMFYRETSAESRYSIEQ